VTSETLLACALALPWAAALVTPLFRNQPNVRETVTLGFGGALFATNIALVGRVLAGERPEFDLVAVMPGLELAFKLEPLGMLFGLVASGLWIVTTFYSIGYMRGHGEVNQTRYYSYFAIAIAAAMGVAYSSNLFALFIFYEILTLSTYPLVTHHQNESAKRAGRVYLGVLLTTSVGLLLLGIIWTWSIAGTLEFTPGGILRGKVDGRQLAVLLALFAFGTGKAALMPFHRWLPAAMVAPTPVSALLHAVAVVKAGVFTVMKVSVYIFGPDLLTETGASVWLMYVAGGTILIASLVAMTKDNLKARLAYSTISQLSYIVLGAALANSWGILGGSMHIAMHAVGKITLFFCAGAYYVAAHKTEISDMRGIGWRMPVTTMAFFIGSLSVIGLPPMGGTWSKWFLALGTADADQLILMAVLMISSLLNIAYLLPIPARGFFFKPSDANGGPVKVKEAPLLCVLPLSLTAIGCVVLFFFADEIYRLILPIVGGVR
jgi:multicomponent Na+:H+ antiporter subunit D